MTVQEIIDGIIAKTGVQPLPPDQTCDHLMAGSYDMEVAKIGVTFMATAEVIECAAKQGINFIITHEPTWFTGRDDTQWLEADPVYLRKKQLIENTGMAIWRFHDHMHADQDDGIFRGFDEEMGWKDYRMPAPDINEGSHFMNGHFDGCYELPKTSLRELALFFKEKLEMDVIQVIGNHDMPVRRVAVLPGGGSLGLGKESMPMELMRSRELDVLICGEILEWTLPSYVFDAWKLGLNKAIIVLGHERSEEAGMKHLGKWLHSVVGDIPVVFVDAKEPFTYLK